MPPLTWHQQRVPGARAPTRFCHTPSASFV